MSHSPRLVPSSVGPDFKDDFYLLQTCRTFPVAFLLFALFRSVLLFGAGECLS